MSEGNNWIKTKDFWPDKEGYYYIYFSNKSAFKFYRGQIMIAFLDNTNMKWILNNPYALIRAFNADDNLTKTARFIESIDIIDKYNSHIITHWKPLCVPPDDE